MQYDVFISHASEDKDSLVRPLVSALAKNNYKIWYDEHSLKLGDSLLSKIDEGLSKSRYGVVILSKSFFAKKWPRLELEGLVAREIENQTKILPVWHGIEKSDILEYSPTLASKIAVDSKQGVEHIAKEISKVINIQITPNEGAATLMDSILDTLPSHFSLEDIITAFNSLFKSNSESLNSGSIKKFRNLIISNFRENKTLIQQYDGHTLYFHNIMKNQ